MIVAAVMTLALAEQPQAKIRPVPPARFAATCKAAAQAMKEGVSIPTGEWRRYELAHRWWEQRHRRFEPDAETRRLQDDAAGEQIGERVSVAGPAGPQRRARIEALHAQCNRAREAAR